MTLLLIVVLDSRGHIVIVVLVVVLRSKGKILEVVLTEQRVTGYCGTIGNVNNTVL